MFLLLMIGHYHYVFCVFVIVVLRVMYNYINVSSSWENYVIVITRLYYRASYDGNYDISHICYAPYEGSNLANQISQRLEAFDQKSKESHSILYWVFIDYRRNEAIMLNKVLTYDNYDQTKYNHMSYCS